MGQVVEGFLNLGRLLRANLWITYLNLCITYVYPVNYLWISINYLWITCEFKFKFKDYFTDIFNLLIS